MKECLMQLRDQDPAMPSINTTLMFRRHSGERIELPVRLWCTAMSELPKDPDRLSYIRTMNMERFEKVAKPFRALALLLVRDTAAAQASEWGELESRLLEAMDQLADSDLPPIPADFSPCTTVHPSLLVDIVSQDWTLVKRWLEHARYLHMRAQDEKAQAERAKISERYMEMVTWIEKRGTSALKTQLADCRVAGEYGPLRGPYIRARAAIEHPGWILIPNKYLMQPPIDMGSFSMLVQQQVDWSRDDLEWSARLSPIKRAWAATDLMTIADGARDATHVSGPGLAAQLATTNFDPPPALQLDMQDDIVALSSGIYPGYVLARSVDMAATKDAMWEMVHTALSAPRGPGDGRYEALHHVPAALTDPRWVKWMQPVFRFKGNVPDNLLAWVSGRSIGSHDDIWTPREIAVAKLVGLSAANPETVVKMREILKREPSTI